MLLVKHKINTKTTNRIEIRHLTAIHPMDWLLSAIVDQNLVDNCPWLCLPLVNLRNLPWRFLTDILSGTSSGSFNR